MVISTYLVIRVNFIAFCFRTFGVVEPNFFGAIDLKTGQSFLYHKEAGAHEALWRGYLPPNKEVGHTLN